MPVIQLIVNQCTVQPGLEIPGLLVPHLAEVLKTDGLHAVKVGGIGELFTRRSLGEGGGIW